MKHESFTPVAPKVLGGTLPRIDGPLKVSGTADYTSDVNLPGMLYAVPVCATIANGKIKSIDDTAARRMRGVKAVYHRGNIKPFFRAAPPKGFSGLIDESGRPLKTMSFNTGDSTWRSFWRRRSSRHRRPRMRCA